MEVVAQGWTQWHSGSTTTAVVDNNGRVAAWQHDSGHSSCELPSCVIGRGGAKHDGNSGGCGVYDTDDNNLTSLSPHLKSLPCDKWRRVRMMWLKNFYNFLLFK